MRESIAENLVRLVKARALYCCEYRLVHEDNFYLSGEVDHIKPIKHGGTNEFSNLSFACVYCNRNKGYTEAIIENGIAVRLFNPRIDHWHDHFFLDYSNIVAKTDIGHVTIKVLKMNDKLRILERDSFILQGSYPPHTQR